MKKNELKELERELIEAMSEKYDSSRDELLISGLHLKGYEFEDEKELFDFIKEHCRAEQYNEETATKTIYYVKDEPFLYIESNPIEPLECNFNWDNYDQKIIIQGDRYKFL